MNGAPSARRTVAVLGAGIMGSSVALMLARRGIHVVLIDAAARPFTGASRWNEGKIHLGYLYGADPSLATARKLLPGGLKFRPLLEMLLERPLREDLVTQHDDRYLIHRDSVASVEQVWAVAQRISALTQQHPDADAYLVPLRGRAPRLLDRGELEADVGTGQIVAGIEVPERSIATQPIADFFVDALLGTSGIERVMRHRVLRVSEGEGRTTRWTVHTRDHTGEAHALGPFDAVVNALWEGRLGIDATVGLPVPQTWTHRYRVSLFARSRQPLPLRSAVVAVGPFGDIKNYDGRSLYLSWYETSLLVETRELQPPAAPVPSGADEQRIVDETLGRLAGIFGAVSSLRTQIETCVVRGGWVYAVGRGGLSDAQSELHRRDRVGELARRSYFSVDTGKYSIAPWLAERVVEALTGM